LHGLSKHKKRWLSIVTLALLALNFLSPALRSVYGFTSGESASTVLGEPNFTTAINPTEALKIPSNLAFDSSGNLWIADAGNNRIIEETNLGPGETATIQTVLGQPGLTTGFASLTQTGMYNPSGLTFDSSGNLWMTDTSNNRVLEYTAPFSDGKAASVVIGQADFTTNDLAAAQSGLTDPAAVAFDSSGDLWVVDGGNNRVLEFQAPFTNGMQASLVIGQPNLSSTAGSTAANGLNFPTSARFDSSGDLWVADGGNDRILEYKAPFSTGMNASLVLGQSSFTTSNAAATQAGLSIPGSLAFDSSGNLWVADTENNRVLEYDLPFSDGMQASLVLGQGSFTSSGAATTATGMMGPTEVAFNPAGDLWVADSFNNRILEFAPPFQAGASAHYVLGQSDYVSTLLDGQGQLYSPTSVTLDSSGDLWVADAQDNRVVEYTAPLSTGMNATLAIGQASLTLSASGGGKGGLSSPFDAVFDQSGNLWVSDTNNNRILEFSPPFTTGMNASLVLGQSSFTTYGNSTSPSGLYYPAGLAFDSAGDLWVTDAGNSRVLEFKAPFTSGMSASLVLGQPSFTSSAPGLSAKGLNFPFSLAFDPLGNLWVADSGNNRVLGFAQPFSNDESASLVVGQTSLTSVRPAISQTGVYIPEAIAFDKAADLWVSDTGNDRVLEFATPLTTGAKASLVIGQATFTTDIPTTSQTNLISPEGMAFDSSGNLWVADSGNDRVVEFPASTGGITTTSTTASSSSSSSSTSTHTTSSTSSTSGASSSSTTSSSTSTSTGSSTSSTTVGTTTSTSSSRSASTSSASSVSTSSKSTSSSTSVSSSAAKSSSTSGTYYIIAGVAVVVVIIVAVAAFVRGRREPWRY
jgi:sugar lactone lactonase YvrE